MNTPQVAGGDPDAVESDAYPAGLRGAGPGSRLGGDAAGRLVIVIGRRTDDGVIPVTLAGPLIGDTRDQLWLVLDQVFRGPACRAVIDAAAVTALDRAGVDILQNVAERAAEWDWPFAVGGLMTQFTTLNCGSGVNPWAYDSVELADQAVRERFVPGEPTRLDLLREIAELRATITVTQAAGLQASIEPLQTGGRSPSPLISVSPGVVDAEAPPAALHHSDDQ